MKNKLQTAGILALCFAALVIVFVVGVYLLSPQQ